MLKTSDGSWSEDDVTLMNEAVVFFRNLFDDSSTAQGAFLVSNSFPQLSSDSLQRLDSIPSGEEIHSALMEKAPLKSPG
ncbi:hypothetical protein V6N11_006763 [Hibiscus sabdariffa]|uniref:Uncharacterized protein n=1 Tax=Hibiscus sabdariffa TaxID=183260 RepID=A0ABR2RSJ5_9ROSI